MKKSAGILFLVFVFVNAFLPGSPTGLCAEPSLAEYTCYPPFLADSVTPNIMIILDNSGSMNFQAYYGSYDHTRRYYGYFEPYQKYSYASNLFTRNAAGAWDGNFLNWLTMRRIDVARKVLMGGLATSRTGGGNQVNIGETPQQSGRDYTKTYDDTDGVTPFAAGTTRSYWVDSGYFRESGVNYTIKVQKDISYPDEANNFVDGNIAGVLQKVGDKARWGNMFFNFGTGNGQSGGKVTATIGTNMTSLITDLQNTGCDTWTPLAETYYVCMQYFKQEQVQSGLDYPNNVVPCSNKGQDPYWHGEFIECAKSFAILLTDGASTMDMMIPAYLKDYDENKPNFGSFPDSGSSYLVDIALYARTNDLRPPGSKPNGEGLDDEQNLILYPIYAFGDDPQARQLIQAAAKNGGFDDRNGNKIPDLQAEWDRDGDGIPDNYFEATDGAELERALISAINAILERAASGTAVAMLANSYDGDATLIQAYFRPRAYDGITELSWLGYLQSLWVDKAGNMREDTDKTDPVTGDPAISLNAMTDKIITYTTDEASGEVRVKRYSSRDCRSEPPDPANPDPSYFYCIDPDTEEVISPEEIEAVWDAGRSLADLDPAERRIFTFLDDGAMGTADDSVVDDGSPQDPFDDLGEVIQFHENSADRIKPYLGVANDASWAYLGADHDTRTDSLISYIRGNDLPGLRTRTIGGKVWKLGDIINSTPVSISAPPENYDLLYRDFSYYRYWNTFRNREAVTYVGANDGMLHAFASWKYEDGEFVRPSDAPLTENIGDELWAYIPRSLLPHLKWLADPWYTHVYYADMWPHITDAKIIANGTHYDDPSGEDSWGMILISGLNFGGKRIVADEDPAMTFDPSYFCLDITDPRNPRLLWERTYAGLQLSTSRPSVMRVGDKWFAVFGSGPQDCNATSSQTGKVFVVDLKTGEPVQSPTAGGEDWLFQTNEGKAFMNSPVSVDLGKAAQGGLNYNVDAVYFGETYLQTTPKTLWKGKLYKMIVPCGSVNPKTGQWEWDPQDGNYIEDPLDAAHPWQFNTFLDLQNPVTAPVSVTGDGRNIWVYAGTGRFYGDEDKSNTDTQYLVGVRDPFYVKTTPDTGNDNPYYGDFNSVFPLIRNDTHLLCTDNAVIFTDRTVKGMEGAGITTFKELEAEINNKWGWYRTLPVSKERMLEKPLVFGGAVLAPSFIPNSDICQYGGDSYLYALYYLTGTAHYDPVLIGNIEYEDPVNPDTSRRISLGSLYLGGGKASRLAVHVGRSQLKRWKQEAQGAGPVDEAVTGIIQSSDSSLIDVDINPPLNIRSRIVGWTQP